MREELITFETAVLAKEKGFDIKTDEYFSSDTKVTSVSYNEYAAPSQSLLQRWLREEHDIDVLVLTEMVNREEMYTVQATHKTKAIFPAIPYIIMFVYEDVLEYGLKEALTLIN